MILVIADDFSGAAEVAGVAHQFGLTAEVQTDALRESGCDVLVVDTNTRSLSPDAASSVMNQLAPSILHAKPRWVFKKIDSVLRGAVLPELRSLSQALGMQASLLINANPRKGRVVRDGELFVDGQPINKTNFANDPEHPRRGSSIVTLLEAESGQVQLVDRVEQVGESIARGPVYVANVESSSDLLPYAVLREDGMLLSGAAEFFEALLSAEVDRPMSPCCADLSLQSSTLIVRGTSVRRRDDDSLGNATGEINFADLGVSGAISEIVRQMSQRGLAMIASRGDRVKADSSQHDPARLHQQLMEVVGRVCSQCPPQQLWIEGGRTASGVVRTCGWDRLRVEGVYSEGVVGLRAVEGNAPLLVVKPGSYPWPVSNP